jgi:hypothetical protein
MVKHFTLRDELPFTFELACTDVLVNNGTRLAPYWLFTLVDIHLGMVIDAVVASQEVSYPREFGPFWEWLEFTGEDTDMLTISIPDSSVLTDDELAALPWDEEIRVVRRSPGQGLHPVHEAAIDMLLDWSGVDVDSEVFGNRFQYLVEELQSYGLYEHRFDIRPDSGDLPQASYQQARTGDVGDEHAAHDFDPWCCGVARLRALQVSAGPAATRRPAPSVTGARKGA